MAEAVETALWGSPDLKSILHVTISGNDASQRLQKTIEEGKTVRLGRAAKQGWEVPWDQMISREHADLKFADGKLKVQCLEQARNPIIFAGKPVREAILGLHEWFQIGTTTFHVSDIVSGSEFTRAAASEPVEFLSEDNSSGSERAFSVDQLRKIAFRNSDGQMELLEQLPERLSQSHSDDDLGSTLSQLLLDAISNAVAVAVGHFDESQLPADVSQIESFPAPLSMRVQTRDSYNG